MTYNVFNKLYKKVAEPVLYYAAGIWGTTNFSKVRTRLGPMFVYKNYFT